jgi:hypothetical protein
MELDTNVDYLTTTFRCPKEWEASVNAIERLIKLPSNRRPWFFRKYSGYFAASSRGHIAMGRHAHGGIIQSSGDYSDFLAANTEKWGVPKMRVTRIDLAVTFALAHPQSLVRQAAEHARDDWNVVLPARGRGGGTLYIGSRSSDAFGRLYDKGAELNRFLDEKNQISTDYLWRAEVEYKSKRARAVYEEFDLAVRSANHRKFVAETVLTWFQGRGCYLPVIAGERSIVSVASRCTDDVRTVKWLREQVRPAVLRLADNGQLDLASDALGLDASTVQVRREPYMGDGIVQFTYFDRIGLDSGA